MKKTFTIAALLLVSIIAQAQKQVSATSPDGQTKVTVTTGDRIYYDIESHGELLFKQCHIGMTLSDRTLGEKPVLKGNKVTKVNETVTPIHPLKFSKVENNYTLLTLTFGGGYKVEWRVYNDGVAYRFVTALKGDIEVMSEDGTWQLAAPAKLVLQQAGGFKTSCEENYSVVQSNEWKADDKMSELPILVMGEKQKVLISEFDLFDYAGVFLKSCGEGSNAFSIIQPKCPTEYEDDGDRKHKILKEADYVAKTQGTRSFPWRYMLITQTDGQLVESTMPVRLAPANVIGDPSWIKVGQTCWDWLNGIPFGPDVTFKSGINLDTYKYFIDFAARNGVGYILIDEGWAKNTRNPFETNPEVHLPEIIAYGKSKGVGVILWLPWLTVEHHIFVDFHGAFHPSGLDYKYPNVLTYEGVRGMEYNGSCKPDNTVWLPFIRNAVGPMDYTPGSMLNYQPERHHGGRPICAGVGTKAFNLAIFVLAESNLQMLMDNPCRYDQWPDCRDFLTSVPVNWDETRVLQAEAGQYCVVAKRRGNQWFIGGITNSTERDIELKLDFLPAGKQYKMTSFEDGVNAHIIAMDYLRKENKVSSTTVQPIHMARNGGWCARIDL